MNKSNGNNTSEEYRQSGKKSNFYNRQDHVLKEEIFFECRKKQSGKSVLLEDNLLCDVKIVTYKNTVENYYHKGHDLRKLKVENKFKLTPREMKNKYNINVFDTSSPSAQFVRARALFGEFMNNAGDYMTKLWAQDKSEDTKKAPSKGFADWEKRFDNTVVKEKQEH